MKIAYTCSAMEGYEISKILKEHIVDLFKKLQEENFFQTLLELAKELSEGKV
jgi:hypothetical protein